MLKTKEKNITSYILIVEDDPDQMGLLAHFAHGEFKRIMADDNTTEAQRLKIQSIKIISATNIRALEKAVHAHKNILLAILDCNIPDTKDQAPHDQFIKTAYKITGQHRAADIVVKSLPNTPITMISSMSRFQKIVTRYYENEHDVHINFIRKKDMDIIKNNIAYYLRKHINE